MRRRHAVFALFALASLFTVGCERSGHLFETPAKLHEGRPQRAARAASGDMPDEDFRAEPPPRLAGKARQHAAPVEARLSNGIRVVLYERHDFPSISAVLVLDRGAAAGAPGVAALYAEALTGESADYKEGEAWGYLQFVGANVQPRVSQDAVLLQVTALTPLFVSALSRAAPMFVVPSFTGDDLEHAWTNIVAERGDERDEPANVATTRLLATLFAPPHPYGVPTNGDIGRRAKRAHEDALEQLSERAAMKGVIAFRDQNLVAERVSVAVVGDFKRETILSSLEKALARLPQKPAAKAAPPPAIAPRGGRRIVIIDRPGAVQSNVAIGWPGPRAADPDLVAVTVLAAASAGHLSTRLNLHVRKELGASYGVHMQPTAWRDAGAVEITTAIETTKTADALRGLFGELGRLRTEPMSAEELEAAKLRSYYDLDEWSTRGLARLFAHALAEGLPPAHVVTHNARVDALTPEAVRAAAEKYLAADEARMVIVGDASRIRAGLEALELGEVTVTSGAR